MHEDSCPQYDLRATEDVALVVRALGEQGLALPLPHEHLDFILDTAQMLHDAKQWSGHELLLRCRDALL